MDAISSLRAMVQRANELLLEVTGDLTVEQTNWLPPGTANPIGLTYAHIVNIQDRYLNAFIGGRPTIWESEGWGERLGILDALRMSRESPVTIDPAAYRAYAERVINATNDYLATVDDAELDRMVQGYRGPISVGELLGKNLAFHAASHLGEICAVKGAQGLKGLPF